MRTQETQEKNLRIARGYACYDVSQAIHASNYSRDDKVTMLRIINASRNEDALERYESADTMVREALQDIIEETYFGKEAAQKRRCPECGGIYTGTPALSRKDNKTAICPDCGTKEAVAAYVQSMMANRGKENTNRKRTLTHRRDGEKGRHNENRRIGGSPY